MYMKVNLVFVDEFFYISDPFLGIAHAVNETVHSVIQILVVKDSLKMCKTIILHLSRCLKDPCKFFCSSFQCLCNTVYAEHSHKQSCQIQYCHNAKKYEVVRHGANRSFSYIHCHYDTSSKHDQKDQCIHNFLAHNTPPVFSLFCI